MIDEDILFNRLRENFLKLVDLAVTDLPANVEETLRETLKTETSAIAKDQLKAILSNIEVARRQHIPICQDTGIQMSHLGVGEDFPLKTKLPLIMAEAVRDATAKALLRPNAVHPLTRLNTGDNTGMHVPYIEWSPTEGNTLDVEVLPKGAGSENMSALKMLNPGDGLKGVKRFVLETVAAAGGKPCPPYILGVGIGLGSDGVMKLARRASVRPLRECSGDPEIADLEKELLGLVNETGIGPMGLGGRTTALAVNIEIGHTHTAGLPVGIIFQCWAARRAAARIYPNGMVEYLSHKVN
jgi:fumarate hydratase subunit alpha